MEVVNLSDNIINNTYRVEKRIGKGSFGDVYIGYDVVNKHRVAIKAVNNKDHQSEIKMY